LSGPALVGIVVAIVVIGTLTWGAMRRRGAG
jgi:hypothetical protein